MQKAAIFVNHGRLEYNKHYEQALKNTIGYHNKGTVPRLLYLRPRVSGQGDTRG